MYDFPSEVESLDSLVMNGQMIRSGTTYALIIIHRSQQVLQEFERETGRNSRVRRIRHEHFCSVLFDRLQGMVIIDLL